MDAIVVRGLRKAYGTRAALDGVDLDVAAGEVHGLVGPNGAGKTTLLRILLQLAAADAGSCVLTVTPVAGFVEAPRFPPELTAAKALRLLASYDSPLPTAPVEEVLAQVELTDRAGDRVGGFSVGLRQRLGIAACLLRRPRTLLLDEPTSGLDPTGAAETRALLTRLAAQGTAVLVSSHDLTKVAEVCHRTTVLRRGQVVFSGTLEQARRIAPTATHVLRTSDDPRALPLIPRATADEQGIVLDADEATLDATVLRLAAEGIAVRRLETRAAPLQALYTQLTAP